VPNAINERANSNTCGAVELALPPAAANSLIPRLIIRNHSKLLAVNHKCLSRYQGRMGMGFVLVLIRLSANAALPVRLKSCIVFLFAPVELRPCQTAQDPEGPPIFRVERVVRGTLDEYDSDRSRNHDGSGISRLFQVNFFGFA
jgi:hypothetical protein